VNCKPIDRQAINDPIKRELLVAFRSMIARRVIGTPTLVATQPG
jgi:hypothetical protein